MMDRGLVDFIISTGANLYHDLHYALNFSLHRGSPFLDDARAAWTRVAEQGSDPLARIEAFDELALLLLERGDPEGAAGMLDRCLVTLSARALEETSEGERVRNALLRMRVVGALRRALAERKDSSASEGSSRTGLTR
jgi:hypothetical protein